MDRRDVLDALTKSVMLVAPEVDLADISVDRTLSDLGCSSIERAEIVSITMETVGADIVISSLHRGCTIGELVSLFAESR